MKNNTNLNYCQDINSLIQKISLSQDNELDHSLKNDPASVFNSFTNGERNVLDVIVSYCKRYDYAYFTQDYLAEQCGITREWANKIIQFLCRLGLISKTYRHMTSCFYFISSKFYDLAWTYGLRDILPSLKLHIWSLLSPRVHTNNRKDNDLNLSSLRRTGKTFMKAIFDKNSYVRDATKLLKASALGVCHLSSLCDEGLSIATEKLRTYKGRIGNKFLWFMTVAKKHCYLNNLPVDPNTTENMIRLLELDRNGPLVEQYLATNSLPPRQPVILTENQKKTSNMFLDILEGRSRFDEDPRKAKKVAYDMLASQKEDLSRFSFVKLKDLLPPFQGDSHDET